MVSQAHLHRLRQASQHPPLLGDEQPSRYRPHRQSSYVPASVSLLLSSRTRLTRCLLLSSRYRRRPNHHPPLRLGLLPPGAHGTQGYRQADSLHLLARASLPLSSPSPFPPPSLPRTDTVLIPQDENNFSSDSIEKTVNSLCYGYARATRAVSLVPVAYCTFTLLPLP